LSRRCMQESLPLPQRLRRCPPLSCPHMPRFPTCPQLPDVPRRPHLLSWLGRPQWLPCISGSPKLSKASATLDSSQARPALAKPRWWTPLSLSSLPRCPCGSGMASALSNTALAKRICPSHSCSGHLCFFFCLPRTLDQREHLLFHRLKVRKVVT